VVHEGTFVVQTGLGGRPESFAAFGAPLRHRGDALDEGIRLVAALFAGATVSSEMFGVVDASIGLVPPDGVEWWIGTMSTAGLVRAGRLGAVWYASHGATAANLPQMIEVYRNAFVPAGGSRPTVALRREAVVLDDGDRARAIVAQALTAGYRGLTREMVVAGTPEDVIDALAPLSALGVDEIMLRTMGVSPGVDLETIELLGRVRDAFNPP
jgi:alkanesulfonate monooxygenase SsuD/methylene tetrahydromethanopterin reductase-like flavin-dependent oxidoreductase (luciferase family)